jgi:hypothetical protein
MGTKFSGTTESARPDLRDTLVKFDTQADRLGFVGLKIAPSLEVSEAFGQYPVIEAEETLKKRETLRANDGSYRRGGGVVGKDNYACEEHGLEERVDNRESRIFQSWFNAEMLAAERCRDAVLRNHNERVIDAAITAASGYTNAAGTAWTVTASADPVKNVVAAMNAIRDRVGVSRGFKLVVEWTRFQNLKDCAAIIDRLKYAGFRDPERNNITATALAQIFDIDELIVSGSLENTAEEPGDVAFAKAWDETKALLFVSPPSNNLRSPQFMRTFHYGADGSSIGGVLESYADNERRGEIVRCRMDTDEKVVYGKCSQTITGV